MICIFVQLHCKIYCIADVTTVSVYMCVWRIDICMMLGVKLQADGWKEELLNCSTFKWINKPSEKRRVQWVVNVAETADI
jgi:hypothetical protein